ncbi:jg20296 [Pararge aegeria aegeria]|uniref:Jg20296 protein n=1 Tax=Pararge aegeria aegeria TaxID=348720 RepID=A0A8S4RLJ4_9NEOP|nr:jg20296 [Pararge aegeria aegeria]
MFSRDQIRNKEICRLTRVSDIAQRVVILKWQRAGHKARRIDGHWGPRCGNGSPVLVSAASVDLQPGGQITSNESRASIGNKRPRIVVFGTLYNATTASEVDVNRLK